MFELPLEGGLPLRPGGQAFLRGRNNANKGSVAWMRAALLGTGALCSRWNAWRQFESRSRFIEIQPTKIGDT